MSGRTCVEALKKAVALLPGLLIILNLSARNAFALEGHEKKSFLKADAEWAFYSFVDKCYKYFKLPFIEVENGTPDLSSRTSGESSVPRASLSLS